MILNSRTNPPQRSALIHDLRIRADLANGVPLWKRCLDVGLVVLTAPIWLPLMIFIGATIKLMSAGPMLFRQERVGFRCRRFMCFKFRTMHIGTDTSTHEKHLAELIQSNRPMTKLDRHDPRLIPLTWLLRSTGLDELPQLFNVLKGEMSLVGPRPCTPSEHKAYSVKQRSRSGTLPGLTGLWQVSGKNRTTFNKMIALDLCYVRTHSLQRDVAILLRTPLALLVQVTDTMLDRKNQSSSSGETVTTQIPTRALLEPGLAAPR
jgi:exopolysaccharide production protein ExoY